MNALDEPEPPVPTNPKALGVPLVGFPNIDWLESPLVAEVEDCSNIDPVAPDGAPKAKKVVGFGCVAMEVDVLVAASSFFPNVNVDAEEDGPNVVVPRAEGGLEMSAALKDFELSVAGTDVNLFSVAPMNANVDFDPSTVPPNTEEGLDVSAEPPKANVGFQPSVEPPKTEGGFGPSVLPSNVDADLEPSVDALNVKVGFFSVELPPKIGT